MNKKMSELDSEHELHDRGSDIGCRVPVDSDGLNPDSEEPAAFRVALRK